MSECPCGAEHEMSPAALDAYRRVTEGKPPAVPLSTTRGTWLVPRIFIACHGVRASELPALAERYGFERISDEGERRPLGPGAAGSMRWNIEQGQLQADEEGGSDGADE